jgi:hypothetical protein
MYCFAQSCYGYVSLCVTLHTCLQCVLVDGSCIASPVYYLCDILGADTSAPGTAVLTSGTGVHAGTEISAGEQTVPLDVVITDRYVVGTERCFSHEPFFSVFFSTVLFHCAAISGCMCCASSALL